MKKETFKIIASAMAEMGIPYDFVEWTSAPVYPYFTGEYQETEPISEDGMQETTFMLTGFARDSGEEKTAYLALENAKEKIENYFHRVSGKVVTTDEGLAVAIFYENSLVVPSADAELKKIQINLSIKEWSVN